MGCSPNTRRKGKGSEKAVSKQQREALKSLRINIKRNAPLVAKKLSRSGAKADPALVYSAAKYYLTLKRLAKE